MTTELTESEKLFWVLKYAQDQVADCEKKLREVTIQFDQAKKEYDYFALEKCKAETILYKMRTIASNLEDALKNSSKQEAKVE
jgi:hypothetical protein